MLEVDLRALEWKLFFVAFWKIWTWKIVNRINTLQILNSFLCIFYRFLLSSFRRWKKWFSPSIEIMSQVTYPKDFVTFHALTLNSRLFRTEVYNYWFGMHDILTMFCFESFFCVHVFVCEWIKWREREEAVARVPNLLIKIECDAFAFYLKYI